MRCNVAASGYPLWVYHGSMVVIFRVQGMSCDHCVATIESAVSRLSGVTAVDVDLTNNIVTVEGTSDELALALAIEDCGYDVDRAALAR